MACRICLDSEPVETLLAPCNCAGSCAFVHRECLDLWRRSLSRCARSPRRALLEYCSTCGFQFELEGECRAPFAGLGPLEMLPALLQCSGRAAGEGRRVREIVSLSLLDVALCTVAGVDLLALSLVPSYFSLSRQVAFTLGCCAYSCLLAMWLQEGFRRRRDGPLALAVHLPALCLALGALARPFGSLASRVQELAGVLRVVPEMASVIVAVLVVAEVREALRDWVRGDDAELPRIKCMRSSGKLRLEAGRENIAAAHRKAHSGGDGAGLRSPGPTASRFVAAA
jgi:hypothetical protein